MLTVEDEIVASQHPTIVTFTASSSELQISIDDAWALVAMADRVNNGRYLKVIEYARDSNGMETGEILHWPNRTLIQNHLATGEPAVTDQDRQFGKVLAEHYQYLIFDVLGDGKNSDYDKTVFDIIQRAAVGVRRDLAYMASLGQRYHRETAREQIAETLQAIGSTSHWQGTVGTEVQRNVVLISKYSGKTFIGSVVRATDGENLYFWTSSRPVDYWPDNKKFKVAATVKSHNMDSSNYKETRLTRVRIIG